MRTEFFSTIKQAYHTWSRNIEDKGYQQFYYAKKGQGLKAMSNMELSMSVKLGKTEIALLAIMALITYLSVTAPKSTVQEATPQPPRPTPTANSKIEILPSADTVVFPPESSIDTLNWDCRTISEKHPNSFRVALDAGIPGVVDPPPYLFDPQGEEPSHKVSALPRLVHNGDKICVKQ